MKTLIFVAAFTLMVAACGYYNDSSTNSVPKTADSQSIQEVIEKAYVNGIYIDRDPAAIRAGFHPGFNMLYIDDGEMHAYPIEDWIGSIESSKAKNPEPPSHETTHEFALIDVTKNAAVAKIKIFRDGKHIYTDYMALYKFGDDWKIVNKIYASH